MLFFSLSVANFSTVEGRGTRLRSALHNKMTSNGNGNSADVEAVEARVAMPTPTMSHYFFNFFIHLSTIFGTVSFFKNCVFKIKEETFDYLSLL